MYGKDIFDDAEGRLNRATIYTHLSNMEDSELITSRKGTPPSRGLSCRRLYKISPKGHNILFESRTNSKGMFGLDGILKA